MDVSNDGHPAGSTSIAQTVIPGRISAASRALAIRELISLILGYIFASKDKGVISTLCSCTLVNSLWNFEANRHVWKTCGTNTPGVKIPTYLHLFTMTRPRAQYYANLIKNLVLCGREAARYLQLPRLHTLTYHCVSLRSGSRTAVAGWAELLRPFLQPQVKMIKISNLSFERFLSVSPKLLRDLRDLCPSLEVMQMNGAGTSQGASFPPFVMPLSLASLFSQLVSLREVSVNVSPLYERDRLMSSNSLQSLARHQALKTLNLASFEDDWIPSLEMDGTSNLFPSLEVLSTKISTIGLRALSSHLRCLRVLKVHAKAKSVGIFSALEDLHAETIEELVVISHATQEMLIVGKDILNLVQKTTNLKRLYLLTGSPARLRSYTTRLQAPLSEGLDDKLMEKIAASIPKIVQLDLYLEETNGSNMTEAALLSLGRHCPLLEYLRIRASVDLWALFDDSRLVWPKLLMLEAHVQESTYNLNRESSGWEDMATHFATQMPSLSLDHVVIDWGWFRASGLGSSSFRGRWF